jgi:hypothetical protein
MYSSSCLMQSTYKRTGPCRRYEKVPQLFHKGSDKVDKCFIEFPLAHDFKQRDEEVI